MWAFDRARVGRVARLLTAVLCVVVAVGAVAAQTGSSSGDEDVIDVLRRASDLLARGDTEEAVSICEALAAKHGEEPRVWFTLGRARQASGDLAGAIEANKRAARHPSVREGAFYNMACVYALRGETEAAFDALHQAKRAGFADRELMATDPDLKSIRDDPRFILPAEKQFFVLDLGDGARLPYAVYLPAGYDPERTYPVLIGPGEGVEEKGRWGSLFWGEDSSQRGWIVVESMAWLAENPKETVARLLDELSDKYHVEGGKFHVAGYSGNSAGAFQSAIEFPERFHSVTGLPGYPKGATEEELRALTGVRINFIVGEHDADWLAGTYEVRNRLEALGIESRLEVIPRGDHILDELFGGEFMDRMQEMRSQR